MPSLATDRPVDRALIETWLTEAGLGHEVVDIGGDTSYAWALAVTGQQFVTLVAQRSVDRVHLYLQTRIGISEPHAEAVRKLPEDSRLTFLFDLRIALLQLAVGYSIEFADSDPTIPATVVFGYNLLETPLQRAGFFRRNHQLQSAALLVGQYFQKLAHLGRWP